MDGSSARTARVLYAAGLALAAELVWSGHLGVGLEAQAFARHALFITVLVGCATALAVLTKSELAGAYVLIVLPGSAALAPLVARLLGPLPALAAGLAGLMTLWVVVKRLGPGDLVAGALVGALFGRALGEFLGRDYAGLSTPISSLAVLAAAAVASVVLYAVLARRAATVWRPRREVAVGLSVWALVLAAAVGGGPPTRGAVGPGDPAVGPPVVLIVLDTVRADHLGLYGYPRDTMPRLGEWASEHAVVVDRAVSNAPGSLAAHGSLFTGMFPVDHGGHRPLLGDPNPPPFGYPLRSDVPTMASLLASAGYVTAGISANHGPVSHELGLGLDRGFDYYSSSRDQTCAFARRSAWRLVSRWLDAALGAGIWLPECRVDYRRAGQITDEALRTLEVMGPGGFLLFVNYMDAHGPYEPPPPFHERFDGFDPAFGRPGPDDSILDPVAEGRGDLPERARRHLESQYDGELSYLDQELARFLDGLRQHREWERILVIVVSDHGEAFGEHRLLDHSTSLYDVMIHVPMLFKFGDRPLLSGGSLRDGRWYEPMQLTDVLPLVVEHAGVDTALAVPGGSPLRAWSFPSPAKRRLSSRYDRELRSIEIDRMKLIESSDGTVELFDLRADPQELRDLSREREDLVQNLLEALGPRDAWRFGQLPELNTLSPDALDRLRSLGYIR